LGLGLARLAKQGRNSSRTIRGQVNEPCAIDTTANSSRVSTGARFTPAVLVLKERPEREAGQWMWQEQGCAGLLRSFFSVRGPHTPSPDMTVARGRR
jgi:hypothetical protein